MVPEGESINVKKAWQHLAGAGAERAHFSTYKQKTERVNLEVEGDYKFSKPILQQECTTCTFTNSTTKWRPDVPIP